MRIPQEKEQLSPVAVLDVTMKTNPADVQFRCLEGLADSETPKGLWQGPLRRNPAGL